MLNRIIITATTLPDAWFQLIYAAVKQGREFKIDRGSYAGQTRLELDWVDVHITKPYLRDVEGLPLIPEMPEGSPMPAPVTKDYVRNYAKYIMTPDKEPGEQYTYGERLCSVFGGIKVKDGDIDFIKSLEDMYFSQIERIIDTYKKYGYRNNQMVLQVAQPADLLLPDPPCLRSIDTRIQDGQLHFFPYFRSWDLWGGFPANLAGISMLQEYMAAEIGVEQGEMICSSKGLHIYGYVKDLAKIRAGIQE
jgi:thymidylate synthase